jgi:ferredoxin-type protein NapG
MVGPLAEFIERRLPIAAEKVYLRPPGALPEDAFLSTCERSGQCIAVCPVDAIKWSRRIGDVHTPVIEPELAACVVCDGLKCTQACPSGALRPLAYPEQIRMGLAVVDGAACLRGSGDDCKVCVDLCPIGEPALTLDGSGPPRVIESGCVGCGVCQQYCPTTPKAIVVRDSEHHR